ncbi:hypothetical protein [Trinickia acidisoli]|uniref:hypothetical protein n=1 Tax=Trinickia acidisoli TaxID=2767482 RepID=UPI001A8FCAF2|nr:hypothetical protein [Trinickia acidisoli]
MSLEESRGRLMAAIEDGAELDVIREFARIWFADIKSWESTDDFATAFKERRMTARATGDDAALKQIGVRKHVETTINLDPSVAGTIARLNADNFLKKLKNDLGLHDLSAVLLRPDIPLANQFFKITAKTIIVFMPIPLEEDLVAFALLSAVAKANRGSELYTEYQGMRANLTRIKYGSSDDMHSGFLIIKKEKTGSPGEDDGRLHVRYGMANIMGGPLSPGLLERRRNNAHAYRTKVAVASQEGENNEVIISYRNHAGLFPLFGKPGSGGLVLTDKKDSKMGTLRSDGAIQP